MVPNKLIAHAVATLPDSITRRKDLLSECLAFMPESHPLKARVDSMLLYLEVHEKQQTELPLLFAEHLKGETK
jgi:hypothetical protein